MQLHCQRFCLRIVSQRKKEMQVRQTLSWVWHSSQKVQFHLQQLIRFMSVSYTHLDVYKRQLLVLAVVCLYQRQTTSTVRSGYTQAGVCDEWNELIAAKTNQKEISLSVDGKRLAKNDIQPYMACLLYTSFAKTMMI